MDAEIRILKGPEEIRPAIGDIARLRLTVFHEWPYLYDGTEADEAAYLEHFAASPHACVGLSVCDGQIVGATTAEPMPSTHEEFRAPFEANDIPTDDIFYFGESVLLSDYRGLGIGHAFFDLREAAARDWGAKHTAFCAVQRPDDHPSKPADYRPLDDFWRGRGYEKRPDLVCHFSWKDVGAARESDKPLLFWMRELQS